MSEQERKQGCNNLRNRLGCFVCFGVPEPQKGKEFHPGFLESAEAACAVAD